MYKRPATFVVLNPKHATQTPQLHFLEGNIIDFMREVGGGAVLVRIVPPTGNRRRFRWTIERIDNSIDVARRSGWDLKRDFELTSGLYMVGGLVEPEEIQPRKDFPSRVQAPVGAPKPGGLRTGKKVSGKRGGVRPTA